MKAKVFAICTLTLTLAFILGISNGKREKDYQAEWCRGQVEVTLSDRTRADCLTETHAIEIEFASKWKNAIGQSLHYALMTGKKAGIALIISKETDQRYLDQLNRVVKANQLPIKVWVIK